MSQNESANATEQYDNLLEAVHDVGGDEQEGTTGNALRHMTTEYPSSVAIDGGAVSFSVYVCGEDAVVVNHRTPNSDIVRVGSHEEMWPGIERVVEYAREDDHSEVLTCDDKYEAATSDWS